MFTRLFDAVSDSLFSLLSKVREGKIQLPDFQRGWVWDDERIRKLLVSISQSFPIGAVMLLETGGPNVSFFPRPVEGVNLADSTQPEQLLLDGQQRLTSLYQSLILKTPVLTRDMKGSKIERCYYIKINSIMSGFNDMEEAIVSIPGDKLVKGLGNIIKEDYSSVEKECDNDVFPVNLIFDNNGAFEWQKIYTKNGTNMDKQQKWLKLYELILCFQQYQIPIIKLSKDNSKEAVCSVFENVNTGGVSLTVFELLTASFAADNFRLRKDWEDREAKLKSPANITSKILADISNVEFLQALCLLATGHSTKTISCKRKDILLLTVDEYKTWADKLTDGMIAAAQFLQEQCVFSTRDLPYGSQIVPLAAILTELGAEAKVHINRMKIARWYWCGVLGELYGGAIETRFVRDYSEVTKWVRDSNASEPITIFDANFAVQRLYTLKTRNSAAYKGLNILLMKNGAKDFYTGLALDIHNYYSIGIDIHHIFPKSYCEKNRIDMSVADCIINKAPLSYSTNRSIGGRRPSEYIRTFDNKNGAVITNEMLQSQCIDKDAIRNDDFNLFIEGRKQRIISLIENAMGKKTV